MIAVLCVAAEHGALIKKKERNKESSLVKLKAFPTNVVQPKYEIELTSSVAYD